VLPFSGHKSSTASRIVPPKLHGTISQKQFCLFPVFTSVRAEYIYIYIYIYFFFKLFY
jgi:hypothetical protein